MPDRGRPALLHQWKSRRGRQRPVCCSDGSGEFGEDHQESVVQVEIEGQLVVSAFDRIVCILLGDVAGGGQQLIVYAWIGCSPVGGHLGR